MAGALDRDCYDVIALCACEALRRTSRTVTAFYQESLVGTGVRAGQLPILVATNLMGPVPVGALADALVIDRTTLTRNLKALEQGGLVVFEADDDRRVRLVVLTDEGRSALKQGLRAWRKAQSQVESMFGNERVRALVSELGALTGTTRG